MFQVDESVRRQIISTLSDSSSVEIKMPNKKVTILI